MATITLTIEVEPQSEEDDPVDRASIIAKDLNAREEVTGVSVISVEG